MQQLTDLKAILHTERCQKPKSKAIVRFDQDSARCGYARYTSWQMTGATQHGDVKFFQTIKYNRNVSVHASASRATRSLEKNVYAITITPSSRHASYHSGTGQNIARVATSAKPQVLYGRRHLRTSALSKNPSLSRDDV